MKSLQILRYTVVLLAFILFMIPAESRDKDQKSTDRLGKVNAINPAQTLININNLTCWVTGTGFHDWIIASSYNGTFPKGTAGFIYAEGILWGGQVSDGQVQVVRVNGNTYSSGTRAGKILTDAAGNVTGREPDDPVNNRPFRVRPDYKTADLTDDAANFYQVTLDKVTDAQRQDIRDQYEVDWNNWPWQKGAPFKDNNNNKTYEPNVDVPGIPGADQTIWIVYNDLDVGRSASTYGSLPIGLEVQETYWAYAATNPLGNVVFKKVKLIYKGTTITPAIARIDSMYIVQWSDPDLGQYTDDFAGCDTTLSLGYVYNSSSIDAVYFNDYGLAPPAGGYDFLQGVMVPGAPTDSALFDFQWRKGFKNLPMTVFTFFAAGSPRSDPDRGGPYDGTLQWYNLMTGFEPRPKYPERVPLRDHLGNITKFELTGDPITGTGDLDGKPTAANPSRFPPGDRRIVLSTGPFTMMRRDTQEVVIALVGGLGKDYLSSLSVLKYNDGFAQYAYDNFFNIATPPPPPKVAMSQLDKQIVLEWGSDLTKVAELENIVRRGFSFEGYNVYQLPSSSARLQDGIRIATFDVPNLTSIIFDKVLDEGSGFIIEKPVQFGSNSGIQRYINITDDKVRNRQLVNGQTYYFAVTAYSYNPDLPADAPFRVLESSPVVLSVTPQSPKPGYRVYTYFGEKLKIQHTSGVADASVDVRIVDPTKITGDNYELQISVTDSIIIEFEGDTIKLPNPKWKFLNKTKNKVLYGPSVKYDVDGEDPLIDGFQVGISGAPFWTAGKEIAEQTYTPPENFNWKGVNWGGNFFGGGLDIGYNFFGSTLKPYQVTKTVEIRFKAADGQKAYNFVRQATGGSSGSPYEGFFQQPFKVFDVTNPASPRQIDFAIMEQFDQPTRNTVWNPGTVSGNREYFYIIDEDYTETAKPEYTGKTLGWTENKPVLYAGWYILNDPSKPPYKDGDVWRIKATNVITANDNWFFSTANLNPTFSNDQAKADVEKVNVFPNPYYGFNIMESTRLEKYVTFNHLPRKATIRIFNIAGVLVRVLDKDDASQFARWDVRNDNNLPVASGIYIVHVDMPDIGKSKILKLALIQEEQILKVY